MTNLEAYLAAVLPGTPKILGLRLRPFSIGHAILLHRLESPFMTGLPGEFGDLLIASEICSRSFHKSSRLVNSRLFASRLRLAGPWRAFRYARSMERQSVEMLGHIANGMSGPETWMRKDIGGQSGASWLQQLRLTQMAIFGKSDAEAMETPVAVALWDLVGWREMEGHVQIVSDHEREICAQLKKERETCRN